MILGLAFELFFLDKEGSVFSLNEKLVALRIKVVLLVLKTFLASQKSMMQLPKADNLLGGRLCDFLKDIAVNPIGQSRAQRIHKGQIESDLVGRFSDDWYGRKSKSLID